MIAKEASGCVYYVSRWALPACARASPPTSAQWVKLVKETQDIPCAVGFGISTPEQAARWPPSRTARDRQLGNRQNLCKVRKRLR